MGRCVETSGCFLLNLCKFVRPVCLPFLAVIPHQFHSCVFEPLENCSGVFFFFNSNDRNSPWNSETTWPECQNASSKLASWLGRLRPGANVLTNVARRLGGLLRSERWNVHSHAQL